MPYSKSSLDKSRIAASLQGLLVGDALAMPVHWYYSPSKLREAYGNLEGMVDPQPVHTESMIQGMSYSGELDILHDKAIYYEGNRVQTNLTKEEIQSKRDDHGNYVGATAEERVHYHQSLRKGQNTTNACIARLLMRYLAQVDKDGYNPYEFLEHFQTYMTTPPNRTDTSQVHFHNDTYLDVYIRGFFANASSHRALRHCALSQRDTWSIGSLDGVVMCIPLIAAYAHEPSSMVVGRAVEHASLTHPSVTVTMVLTVLVPILLDLYHGGDVRETLEKHMLTVRPPACTGRQMRDSYVAHKGPGNIPKAAKWKQHMETADENMLEFCLRVLDQDDEGVAGWGDRPDSRLSTACYCEQTFAVVLYLAYKYHDDPKQALLQNAKVGGVSLHSICE